MVTKTPLGRVVAGGMLRTGTPVQDYRADYGLWVKREDLACPPPGPPFSKTRGVYAHVLKRPEAVIGVLDTFHSQAGHAVARACQVLGKRCYNFYPRYKSDPPGVYRPPQDKAALLGAQLVSLPAGRSCILFHRARKETEALGGYMMPNALKLPESVEETARELTAWPVGCRTILVPASSATIAAGVLRGWRRMFPNGDWLTFVVHLGYSRPAAEVLRYLREASGVDLAGVRVEVIDEGYAYKDKAAPGEAPPWPCNEYYDLKAFRWWLREGRARLGTALFWNVG